MDLIQIAGISAGVVLGAVGLWLLRGGKRVIARDPSRERSAADGVGGHGGASRGEEGLSGPTRLTLGVVCLLVGYHAVCWTVPAVSFGVPLDRWWLVAAGAVLAVVGALAVDLVESDG